MIGQSVKQLVAIALLCAAQGTLAASIIAEGKSSIQGGNLSLARQQAIADAARSALMRSGVEVSSSTQVINATEVDDRIHVSTSGQIEDIEVVDEQKRDDLYRVTIRAEINPQGASHCPAGRYQKSLLVTAFGQMRPATTRVGELHNAETALPQTLAKRLYPEYNLQVQSQPELLLASTNRLQSNHYELYNAVQLVASEYQSQYVLTGYVEDMSMVDANGYYHSNSLGRSANRVSSTVKSWVGAERGDIRERHFRFRVMLHDGVTGERIFDKSYATRGLWTAGYTARTGFATPGFWQTDYGRKANELIDRAVADVGEKALCQPFMAPLKVAPQTGEVYLLAGANSGVNVGDSFNVYIQGAAPFANIQHYGTMALAPVAYKNLNDTQATLTVTQTYPGYSIGRFSGPMQPHLQYMALAQ